MEDSLEGVDEYVEDSIEIVENSIEDLEESRKVIPNSLEKVEDLVKVVCSTFNGGKWTQWLQVKTNVVRTMLKILLPKFY